jgi:predicted small integral membrane protein
MLRKAKILLIVVVALWGFMGALGNVTDWNGTLAAVGAVTSMATFEGGPVWRATSHPLVAWSGALLIMLSKLLAGIMCSIGALKMWHARAAEGMAFNAAKQFALTGCAIAVLMLFGGFIVIAETWFELWRSDVMRGPVLDSAFRYSGLILLIALFVATRDE